ncbi:MAG: nitrate reductase subunit alpha [Deltaproteobacteria bacterium]
MSWVKDIFDPDERRWEEIYRNRFQTDKVVRSTHGVNCTGGCSWNVHVKNGVVALETQATDYPRISADVPAYEPRGCQRGISASWYLYSPLRVKYPYLRGVLMDLWREARKVHPDPVAAWASIVNDPEKRRSYQEARGKGGLRRSSWDEVLELTAASTIHTIKQHGSDRIIGFSPIPAMSMLSFAAGSRFLQLLGGVNLSFYDWYCDLPNASPEVWGEQTDVAESADWYHSKFIVSMGANLGMTRTPDVHFAAEARHDGAKLVVLSPDFSMTSKYADQWIPIHAGQDAAFWLAVDHVILKEFHHEKQTPYFLDYVRRYSDAPFLVELEDHAGVLRPGRMLRASQLARTRDAENGDFKFLVWDGAANAPRMPRGTLGFRWQHEKGQWNLEMKDGIDGLAIDAQTSFLGSAPAVAQVAFDEYASGKVALRGVPVRTVETLGGPVTVATVYDLLFAQYGVSRGLAGDYPSTYDDADAAYTPAWQERFTGVSPAEVIRFAREWATTAEKTGGKCSVIIGAGVNQWYHGDHAYRAAIAGLVLCGCIGKNGGGLNHYVGQEKLAPVAPWSALAFALDWAGPPRLQNAPSFHYVHSDQWRYERASEDEKLNPLPEPSDFATRHTMDHQARAVRMGWLPFFPQFDRTPTAVVNDARAAGATTDAEVSSWVVRQLKEKKLKFSVEDPDAPENWPRLWFIWRGNALMSSAKGHEYFLRHYLGTHSNAVAEETARGEVEEVAWRDPAPKGKLDLVVDLNFRMDTTALYSDVILPAATWYEKDDLNSTDMHSFIHPLQAAVPPCWESRSDWDIFKAIAEKVSDLAKAHLPEPVREIVTRPLQHDTPAEMAQRELRDWARGECEPEPGKTMPGLSYVDRDYVNLHKRFISFGPVVRAQGIGAHGITWPVDDLYDELVRDRATEEWGGKRYPSLAIAKDAANVILHLAPETNGESAFRAFAAEEKKVGLPLTDLVAGSRNVRTTFADLARQPRRLLDSPCWTGITGNGRTYSAYCLNVERLVPWRTLTGRQHFYLDHPGFIAFGEALPTYKPKPGPDLVRDLESSGNGKQGLLLNYLTPHGKWGIHSTFGDNLRMLSLSRGTHPLWMNDKDAASIGLEDNDWVEAFNDHGVVVVRCVVSARIPTGLCLLYHAPERTIGVPKSPERGGKRAGGHNSLTRVRLKPTLMLGGYGQFTFALNYWGPTGNNRDTFIRVRKLVGAPQY